MTDSDGGARRRTTSPSTSPVADATVVGQPLSQHEGTQVAHVREAAMLAQCPPLPSVMWLVNWVCCPS